MDLKEFCDVGQVNNGASSSTTLLTQNNAISHLVTVSFNFSINYTTFVMRFVQMGSNGGLITFCMIGKIGKMALWLTIQHEL